MKTLNDWKYEIAFNNERYIDVKNYTLFLQQKEKAVMDKQVEFYRTRYSFDALLNKLRVSDDRRRNGLLLIASKNAKNILYTPGELKQYYLRVISKEFPKYKHTLTSLLLKSISLKPKNAIKSQYKAIFGAYFKDIKRKVKKYSQRTLQIVPMNQKLTEFSYIRELDDVAKRMAGDSAGQGIFGKYTLNNPQFTYNNLYGLGQYHFNKILSNQNDVFVLNSSNYMLSLNKLHHLFYLNVYPGKGHFVNTLYSKTRTNCMDFGATYAVNGWATFAMWHYNQNTYTRNLKAICGRVGMAFLSRNYYKGIKRAYNFLLGLLPKDEAQQYLIYMTQYPGLIESYIFGAIATESAIDKGFASSPKDYLEQLKTRNIGDFFFEYTK